MLEPGRVINGRYLLGSLLGAGAMGEVWRAQDSILRREVAIKFLSVGNGGDPAPRVEQFLREARLAASVQHRNVVHVVDFGTLPEARPFMVMELLDGQDLGDRMQQAPRLTHGQFIHVIAVTLRGLAAVHDAGIVHRDLKPQNIFLQRDADTVYPKIVDFGISRSLERDSLRPSAVATTEGLIIGTPDYMSPEQARGEGNVDKRSDIFSMAVILYEGLAGRVPFQAPTVGELIVQIMTQDPADLRTLCPELPEALSGMIGQAMAKDREQRFADAHAMRRALLAAAQTLLPVSRASSASLAPPPAALLDAAKARPAPEGPPPASSADRGGGWGDFEGLGTPGGRGGKAGVDPARKGSSSQTLRKQRLSGQQAVTRDLNPAGFQSAAVADQVAQRKERAVKSPAPPVAESAAKVAAPLGLPGAEEPVAVAPPADRASVDGNSSKNRISLARAAGVEDGRSLARAAVGVEDGLDPLYAGSDQAAPDIDYDRVAGVKKVQTRVGAPAQPVIDPGRAQPQSKAKPRSSRSTDRGARVKDPRVWALAALVLGLLAYATFQGGTDPSTDASPPGSATKPAESALMRRSADDELRRLRLQVVKSRRDRPGKQLPHMRDVEF